MPPFLPPELVTISFDHLYDSLCYHPGKGTYETPIGAGYIFSNLSLVSKTWHTLALPFLVRNFQDDFESSKGLEEYLEYLRKYNLSKHVQSVAVLLRSENGKSSCPLVRELFAEVGPVWKPKMVEIKLLSPPGDTHFHECLATSLPFFRETSSLHLINFDFSFPRQWIPQLPARLSILHCQLVERPSGPDDLTTSLQLEIARLCSKTLRVLSIRQHDRSWTQDPQTLFGETVFPFLTNLHLFAVRCADFDVSYHFPQLRSVALPMPLIPVNLPLYNLPRSLQSLTFYDVIELNIDDIADGLKDLLVPVESLKYFRLCVKFSPAGFFESIGELLEHPKCVVVSDLCKERGIRFSFHEVDPIWDGVAVEPVEAKRGLLSRAEGAEEDGSLSLEQDDDLDFDAEDGEEFRHLWSEEKLARLATGLVPSSRCAPKTCRYQGDMNAEQRQKSLKVLKKSKKCKVMLLSLKCGGVGLTLTRANRVISLDLAWSFAVEAQAYDRTHRIGQLKPVFVKRLTIANTVEQRIFDLQTKKQGLADASLGEGKAQKLGKMTVAELAQLFGLH
ncbi:hypothetical protein JCM5350_001444 [Sporobolomyces pararoseus]